MMRIKLLFLAVLVTTFSGVVSGSTFTFVGTGDWNTPENWSSNCVPDAGDDVVIDGNVTLTNATPLLASYTLNDSRVHTFDGWGTVLSSAVVNVNGMMTHTKNTATNAVDGVWIPNSRVNVVCDEMTISASGVIDVSGKGYGGGQIKGQPGFGPGGGGIDAIYHSYFGGNAGYGGVGALGALPFGHPYGDAQAPTDPGSGGGCRITTMAHYSGVGGAGGGAVRIEAHETVVVKGAIRADGSSRGYPYGGCGSGGSVFISCRTLTGNGGIQATGESGVHSLYTGGGGGRIAVIYDPEVQATLAAPSVVFNAGGGFGVGDLGTLYFPDNQLLFSQPGLIPHRGQWLPPLVNLECSSLTLNDAKIRFPADGFQLSIAGDLTVQGSDPYYTGLEMSNAWVSCGGNILLNKSSLRLYAGAAGGSQLDCGGNLSLASTAGLYVYATTNFVYAETNGGSRVSVAGDLSITSASWIYPVSHPVTGGSTLFQASNLFVEASAGFNASGRGFGGGNPGRGYGPGHSLDFRSGGGYGGMGGGTAGGPVYGSATFPTWPGSGGGSMYSTRSGGNGGGVIWLEVKDAVVLDGTLAADGGAYSDDCYSGGSGGGILVACQTFSGSGTISANGGNSGSFPSDGGGGRIAVWQGLPESEYERILAGDTSGILVSDDPLEFTGAASVTGGTGGIELPAFPGTITFLSFLPLPRGFAFSVLPMPEDVASVSTNAIPFTESFETIPADDYLNGRGGWAANGEDDCSQVIAQSYNYTGVAGTPLHETNHTQVVQLNTEGGTLYQAVTGTQQHVWIDMMARMSPREDLMPVQYDRPVMGFYVYASEDATHPTVACRLPNGSGPTNVIYPAMIDCESWHRLTVHLVYLEPSASPWFSVWLDGSALTSPLAAVNPGDNLADPAGIWLRCVTNLPSSFPGLAFMGTGYIDDLVVSGSNPFSSGAVIRLTGDLDFGGGVTNTSASRMLRVWNDGDEPLNVFDVQCPNGFWPLLTNCTVAAASSQLVEVSFTPTALGLHEGLISVISDAVAGTNAIAVSGTGLPISRTLTVASAHGGADPAEGVYTYEDGAVLNLAVTNSPVFNGTTQYICTAASVSGNAFEQASPTEVALTLTNNATVAWQWGTRYLLTAATNGCGTVTGDGWYDDGSNAVLTATAVTGYTFTGWSGDTSGCSIQGTTLTAPMNRTRQVTATFSKRIYNILATCDSHGTITPGGLVSAPYGTNITFTITCEPGYKISRLVVDSGSYDPTNKYSFVNVASSHFIYVEITRRLYELTVVSAHGRTDPVAGVHTYDYGMALDLSVTNSPVFTGATQYVCTAATVTGNAFDQTSPTEVSLTLTNSATIAWQWGTRYLLTAATNGNGAVKGDGWYDDGSNAVVSASAAAGWRFAGWSGDTNEGDIVGATLTAPMIAARNIVAQFVEANKPPVLLPVDDYRVDEMTLLEVPISATDPDAGDALAFSLGVGAPSGAAINAETGLFTWIPSEAQGPDEYTIQVIVTDNGIPSLSATNSLFIVVDETNQRPILEHLSDLTVAPGGSIVFDVSVSDPDWPVNMIEFDLMVFGLGEAPSTPVTFDSVLGHFAWMPATADTGNVFFFVITATDDGDPPLSSSRGFRAQVVASDAIGAVTIQAGPPPLLRWNSVSGLWYQVQSKALLGDSDWLDLGAPVTALGETCEYTDGTAGGAAQRFYRVIVVP